MSNPTSLVPISKEAATRAAQAMLDSIPTLKQKEREESIVGLMRDRVWQWRWPLLRLRTRAEAAVMVDDEDIREEWGWLGVPNYRLWVTAGCGREAFAERLQSACALTRDGSIWLNLDEAKTVHGWLT